MISKKILDRFVLTEEDLTKSGTMPGVLVDLNKKFHYDTVLKSYTNTVEFIVLTCCFSAFYFEKIAVRLPVDSLSDADFLVLEKRLENDDPIFVKFTNLKLSLSQGKELMLRAIADGFSVLDEESGDMVWN